MAIDAIGRKKITDKSLRQVHAILETTKKWTKNAQLKKKLHKAILVTREAFLINLRQESVV